jgi:hypothetical protein
VPATSAGATVSIFDALTMSSMARRFQRLHRMSACWKSAAWAAEDAVGLSSTTSLAVVTPRASSDSTHLESVSSCWFVRPSLPARDAAPCYRSTGPGPAGGRRNGHGPQLLSSLTLLRKVLQLPSSPTPNPSWIPTPAPVAHPCPTPIPFRIPMPAPRVLHSNSTELHEVSAVPSMVKSVLLARSRCWHGSGR